MSTAQRTLGNSGINVSAIGFGCWPIGGMFTLDGKPDGYGAADDAVSLRALRVAVDNGITFFDTADAYGAGHSEYVLGRAFEGMRDKVVICTKFGFTYDESARALTGNDVSPSYIRWACEQSLRRLRTDYIDLYTLHVGSLPEPDALAALDTLAALRDEGKIRAYCWSTWLPEAGRLLARHGGTALMHECNVFTPKDELLAICERNSLASINISPLAMGLLSGKYTAASRLSTGEVRGSGHDWVAYFKNGAPVAKYLDQLTAIREVLSSGGRTLAQGALCWVLAKSPVTIPIPGFKTEAQALENTRALSFGPLTNEQMAQIDELLRV